MNIKKLKPPKHKDTKFSYIFLVTWRLGGSKIII